MASVAATSGRTTGLRRLARYAFGAALILAVAAATPTVAQDAAPVGPQAKAPPYDEGLLRLSEILGSLHYLRQLCSAGEGSMWRREMQALIDAEAADPARRARIVDNFNRGYNSFKAVYRKCTPAATAAIDRYMDEGARIARDTVARYGRVE
jgi:uncharacterized protein (TIGR02301 family)